MSRVFSIPTFLRQTSNHLLRELLARLGHADLSIPWDDLQEKDIDPIHQALKSLTAAHFDDIEGQCRSLFDLACTTGLPAIREAAQAMECETILADLPQDAGLYDPVVWAWLHNDELVQLAGLIHRVENLSWWRRRTDLPQRQPNTSSEALQELGQEVSKLLEREQGRGRQCTVEPLIRIGSHFYFTYPDDYVQNVTAHDNEGRLTPQRFRQTFSIVFAFIPAEGALELYAGRLSPRIKQQLEAIFARVVLGVTIGEWTQPSYHLDLLKYRTVPLETDPADQIEVSIREMRFTLRGTRRQITLKADPNRGRQDIHDMIEEVLDRERMPLSSLDVDLVTFCFEFLNAPANRGRTLTFQVARPNTCSLRNQRQDRIDLAMRYLTRWGIHVQRSGPDLAAG